MKKGLKGGKPRPSGRGWTTPLKLHLNISFSNVLLMPTVGFRFRAYADGDGQGGAMKQEARPLRSG